MVKPRGPAKLGPISERVERRAKSEARREKIPLPQARANVRRSVALRAYWTRARSYADKHKTSVAKARVARGFRANERVIRHTSDPDASERELQRDAERLIRALERQGLRIGKGKTWRDYVRKRRKG